MTATTNNQLLGAKLKSSSHGLGNCFEFPASLKCI